MAVSSTLSEETPLAVIKDLLVSPDTDIVQRMLALFYCRYHDVPESIDVLESALWHESVLLRHEVAYVIGQMSQSKGLAACMRLLDQQDEHPMVRHEAAEAIAALGITSDAAFDCLERHKNDTNQAVRETVELALIGLQRERDKRGITSEPRRTRKDPTTGFYIFTVSQRPDVPNEYAVTRDPAEGDPDKTNAEHVLALGALLRDDSGNSSLWDRYVAMFTLRNINSKEACQQLALSLDEKSSALLRHEVCFVLGQMQLPDSVHKMIERLEDLQEADMVRHEAALGLGSVGADIWSSEGREARKLAITALKRFSTDPEPVVSESCLVGLYNIEWETGKSNDDLAD